MTCNLANIWKKVKSPNLIHRVIYSILGGKKKVKYQSESGLTSNIISANYLRDRTVSGKPNKMQRKLIYLEHVHHRDKFSQPNNLKFFDKII